MLHDSYFTLSFIARKARALRNGEYPIFVRITVSGQISEMNLGRSVAPENWDQKRAMSKGRSRRDLELNKYIEVVKARFLEIHNMLVREGKMVNPKILSDHFLGTVEKPKMLCDVFREANGKRKEELDRGDIVKATYQRWMSSNNFSRTTRKYSKKRCNPTSPPSTARQPPNLLPPTKCRTTEWESTTMKRTAKQSSAMSNLREWKLPLNPRAQRNQWCRTLQHPYRYQKVASGYEHASAAGFRTSGPKL